MQEAPWRGKRRGSRATRDPGSPPSAAPLRAARRLTMPAVGQARRTPAAAKMKPRPARGLERSAGDRRQRPLRSPPSPPREPRAERAGSRPCRRLPTRPRAGSPRASLPAPNRPVAPAAAAGQGRTSAEAPSAPPARRPAARPAEARRAEPERARERSSRKANPPPRAARRPSPWPRTVREPSPPPLTARNPPGRSGRRGQSCRGAPRSRATGTTSARTAFLGRSPASVSAPSSPPVRHGPTAARPPD